jgi:hypothetical protein
MNGYQLTRQWFEWRFNNPGKLSSAHAELYFYIVDRWNYFGQKSEFGLPRLHTMEVLSIGSRNTYKKLFGDLIEHGFIKLIRESCNQYHHASIIGLSKFEQAPETPLETPTEQAHEQAPDPIGKPNNLGTKEHIDIKPKAKKKKEKVEFIAPTIEQVQEYFTEKAYPLQLVEKVFNHYNDKEWHKSNGQPVIDWKRTISNNWEDHFQQWRQRKTSNVNRGNSQPQVDPSKIINYGKGNGAVVYSEKYNVYYEPIHNGQPPKEFNDLIFLDQGNHSNYGEYVKWMLRNDRHPLPPEDTRYFPADFNFEKFVSEQKAILANSNQ